MQVQRLLILLSLFTFFLVNRASAQVEDTVLRSTDTTKSVKKPVIQPKIMTRQDSMKARYVNPGKVAGRKAIFRSMIFPGLGQIYNLHLLNDGYGERAGKSQTGQRIYTIGKIGAIYGGFTALTIAYLDNRKLYKRFLAEAQYREANPGKENDLVQYSDAGVLSGKSTYKRNSQIVIFSYGLVYIANIVDAYVAARLHFFNIDDQLGFKISPSVINSSNMYGFSANPAVKLSFTF